MNPPTHDITAPIRYVSVEDAAWLTDDGEKNPRWTVELAPLEGAALDAHPLRLYYSGATRYDLEAPGEYNGDAFKPSDYLDGRPVVFVLRRLKVAEMTACRDLPPAAQAELAFRLCCKAIENGPEGMSFNPSKNGAAKDSHLEEVAAYLGMEVIYEAGRAALRASAPPSYAEKKP